MLRISMTRLTRALCLLAGLASQGVSCKDSDIVHAFDEVSLGFTLPTAPVLKQNSPDCTIRQHYLATMLRWFHMRQFAGSSGLLEPKPWYYFDRFHQTHWQERDGRVPEHRRYPR